MIDRRADPRTEDRIVFELLRTERGGAEPSVVGHATFANGRSTVDAPDAVESLIAESSTRRYDFGVTAGYLEFADKKTGAALIARLRDVLVRRLCVILPSAARAEATAWTDGELTAFGLTLLGTSKHEVEGQRVYGFDISSYKRTPDWLNPRHWANPERWNKDRW